MKYSHYIIFFVGLYASGCATNKDTIEKSRKIASIKTSFSDRQLSMDSCLIETDSSCSLGDLVCQQETAISCSAKIYGDEESERLTVQTNELIESNVDFNKHAWFLLNPSKISKTLKFIKRLNSTYKKIKSIGLDSLHGHGAGVFASAYLVEGRNFSLESMIFNREMNLYCAPGMQYTTDIGVQAGFNKSIALGCKDNLAYEGQFVSVGGGISFTNFAIPFGVQAAYSFGLSTKVLKEKIKQSQINSESLLDEFKQLQLLLPQFIVNADLTEVQQRALKLALIIATSSLGEIDFSKSLVEDVKSSEFDLSGINRKYSLGIVAKGILSSAQLNDFLENYNFENTKKILSSLNYALTGCDGISGSISAEFSAMPVNISVASTMYKKLLSVDIDKITSLKNLSSFMLLNPIFMDRYTFSKVIEVAVLVDQLPNIIVNKCYGDEYHEMTKALSLGQYLIR